MARAIPVRAPKRVHEAVLVRQDDRRTWNPDAVISVSVSENWTITEHPVEEGVVVTDHVQVQPATIVLSCVLTENPLSTGGVIGGPVHLQTEIDFLLETADGGRLVDVVTRRMGIFEGYLIQSVPYTLDGVARLKFDLTLREVRIASATTVFITVEDVAEDTAAGAPDEVDAGEQATTSTETDEAAEEADQSALSALLAAV